MTTPTVLHLPHVRPTTAIADDYLRLSQQIDVFLLGLSMDESARARELPTLPLHAVYLFSLGCNAPERADQAIEQTLGLPGLFDMIDCTLRYRSSGDDAQTVAVSVLVSAHSYLYVLTQIATLSGADWLMIASAAADLRDRLRTRLAQPLIVQRQIEAALAA